MSSTEGQDSTVRDEEDGSGRAPGDAKIIMSAPISWYPSTNGQKIDWADLKSSDDEGESDKQETIEDGASLLPEVDGAGDNYDDPAEGCAQEPASPLSTAEKKKQFREGFQVSANKFDQILRNNKEVQRLRTRWTDYRI